MVYNDGNHNKENVLPGVFHVYDLKNICHNHGAAILPNVWRTLYLSEGCRRTEKSEEKKVLCKWVEEGQVSLLRTVCNLLRHNLNKKYITTK